MTSTSRSDLQAAFDHWVVSSGYGYRIGDRILFHRCGGDGLFAAFCAGHQHALTPEPEPVNDDNDDDNPPGYYHAYV